MNLYQKIQAVMKDVAYLCKDDKVEFGSTKYKAISEEKVTSTVRASMIKNGLVMIPVGVEMKREGQITSTQNTYKIVDVDKPEDFELVASCGQGSDSQDKGSGKSMTYAFKYALLRTFMIPTGEDPDKISSAELDAKYESESKESNPDMVRNIILALGTSLGKDEEYTKEWCEKLFGGTTKWEDLTPAQLATAKLKLSEALKKNANKGK